MDAVPRRLSGDFSRTYGEKQISTRGSRKRKAEKLEFDAENVQEPETKKQLVHFGEQDIKTIHKLRHQKGLIDMEVLSPNIRGRLQEHNQQVNTCLFLLSPNGERKDCYPSVGKSFTAKKVSVKSHRKRARLNNTKQTGLWRPRQLSILSAEDSVIRDCTPLELEEHSKKKATNILQVENKPSLTLAIKKPEPEVSESQSIIGAALAEAKQFKPEEKKENVKNDDSNKPAEASTPTFNANKNISAFQFGTTNTSDTNLTPPASSTPTFSFNAGAQSSSTPLFSLGAAPQSQPRRKGRRKR